MLFNLMPHHTFAESDLVVTAAFFSCSSPAVCKRNGNFVDQAINAKAKPEICMIAKMIGQSTQADPAQNASGNRWRKLSE